MRVFVSVDVGALAEGIAPIQEPLADADGLRLTDPAQAHVTLKFLGETPERRLPAVVDAVERAVAESGVEPFRVKLGGLGVFPSTEYITVVWLGVREGGEWLAELHERVEEHTTALGYNPADHSFTPHVTLARMDHAGSKRQVQEFVETRAPSAGAVTVDAVCVTESTLTDDGPVYETVERFELNG